MRLGKAAAIGVAVGFMMLGGGLASQAGEIGDDDFRISNIGDVFGSGQSEDPSVAFNSANEEFLVVWEERGNNAEGKEAFGQRINSVTGDLVGDAFQISQMGGAGNSAGEVENPFAIYNPTDNEYLVVWSGDDGRNGLVDGENEIFGQKLAADGAKIGDAFRISDTGPLGNATFDAIFPLGVYNPNTEEYVVVWSGADAVAAQFSAFGQRIDAKTGNEVGTDDFPIGGVPSFSGNIVLNTTDREYLVVLSKNNEDEIVAQRLSEDGTKIGGEISVGNKNVRDQGPMVAYDSLDNEYLVVWEADDGTSTFEVFGQRLDAAGSPIGDDDFQISKAGPSAADAFEGFSAFPIYNTANNEYFVQWSEDSGVAPLVDDEFEAFGQRFDASSGAAIGDNFRISAAGTDGDDSTGAFTGFGSLPYDPVRNTVLVVWRANDGLDSRREVSGQFLRDAKCGNGVVESEGSETCDDGNTVAGDGCDAVCLVEAGGGGGGGGNGGGCSLIR